MSDVRPFEEYKEMIKDMRKEEMIKGLYDLSARVTRQENIIKEVREYITSYESISAIQGLEDIEANKDLDEKTLNEMVRRYMIVHDKLLEILDKENK